VSANPAKGERYFLRVLLNHVAGSQSFKDLKTVHGVLCDIFHLAAQRRGLIEADNTLDQCLTESAQWAMPVLLRGLFPTILVFCEASDVRAYGIGTLRRCPPTSGYRGGSRGVA
jgi:hypothetical protein